MVSHQMKISFLELRRSDRFIVFDMYINDRRIDMMKGARLC